MAVPLFLSPQAFEPSPPGVAKNSRHIFTVACAIRVATGSLSFVAGDMIWGIWQLLTAFFAFGILRRTTASAVLLIASLFGVELLLSVINLIEMIPKLSYGDPPLISREPKLIIAAILLRPSTAILFFTTSLVYYFALTKLHEPFTMPNLLFSVAAAEESGEEAVRFAQPPRTLED